MLRSATAQPRRRRSPNIEGGEATRYHGYSLANRCTYENSAVCSSSVGLSGNLAIVVCSTFHAALPNSALKYVISNVPGRRSFEGESRHLLQCFVAQGGHNGATLQGIGLDSDVMYGRVAVGNCRFTRAAQSNVEERYQSSSNEEKDKESAICHGTSRWSHWKLFVWACKHQLP